MVRLGHSPRQGELPSRCGWIRRRFECLHINKSDSSAGVLAPRGWHGFGGYGTSGLNLTVVPRPMNSFDDLGRDITGPGIQVHSISGEMSGRYSVAKVIARVFPTQRAFTESVIKEGISPASDFPVGPYPNDKLTYQSDLVVQFQTPPHSQGLGTTFGLTPNNEPINGVVIMQGTGAEESPSSLSRSDTRPPQWLERLPLS